MRGGAAAAAVPPKTSLGERVPVGAVIGTGGTYCWAVLTAESIPLGKSADEIVAKRVVGRGEQEAIALATAASNID